MPRGYRFLIAASGLGALIWATVFGYSLAASNYPNEKRYQAYRYPSDDENGAITAISKGIHSFEYREPCHNPKGHDESDLCAQWRAANAAENSAFWAKWSFSVTVLGAIGLGITLWFNLKAWEAAKKANEISEDTARRQLRAYVSQEGWDWRFYSADNANIDRWDVNIDWVNGGVTPTRNLRLLLWKYSEINDIPEEYLFDYKPENPGTSLHIPPNGKRTSVRIDFSPSELLEAQRGARFLYLWGWAKYHDVIAQIPEHITKFCYRVYIVGDPTKVPAESEAVKFFSMPHWRHNCADEECMTKPCLS